MRKVPHLSALRLRLLRKPAAVVVFGVIVGLITSMGECADSPDQDVSMFLQNFAEPFVTRTFAEQLALLVMSEKYPGTTLAYAPPEIVDNGEEWWVTIKVSHWDAPKSLSYNGVVARQITIVIRKKDAAVLSMK